MIDPRLAEAFDDADDQYRRAGRQFAALVELARRLLAEHDETVAWALVSRHVAGELDAQAAGPHFAADMVAAAAIRQALHEDRAR